MDTVVYTVLVFDPQIKQNQGTTLVVRCMMPSSSVKRLSVSHSLPWRKHPFAPALPQPRITPSNSVEKLFKVALHDTQHVATSTQCKHYKIISKHYTTTYPDLPDLHFFFFFLFPRNLLDPEKQ